MGNENGLWESGALAALGRGDAAKEEYNLGWMLMRPLACFAVILEHFWELPEEIRVWQLPFYYICGLSVPVFMLLSFYLTGDRLAGGDAGYCRKRLWRIWWPLLGWAAVYYVAQSLLSLFTSTPSPAFRDFLWQASLGHSRSLNPPMWYQFDLLLLALGTVALGRRVGKRWLPAVLAAAFAGALALEQSGLNFAIFGGLPYETRFPLGRIVEMIPYAVLGFAASRYDWLRRIDAVGKWLLLPAFAIFFIAAMRVKACPVYGDFCYSGVTLLVAAVGLFATFRFLPLAWIGDRLRGFLATASSYTLGIYSLHFLVAPYTAKVLSLVWPTASTFTVCVMTYLVCYAICRLMDMVGSKRVSALVR